MDNFIVAEITKNWEQGISDSSLLIGQTFEAVINLNDLRGYKLIDWRLSSRLHDEVFTETIIAIFKLKE